jgi:hypothetical protein
MPWNRGAGKFVQNSAMKEYRGEKSIAPTIFNLGARWR